MRGRICKWHLINGERGPRKLTSIDERRGFSSRWAINEEMESMIAAIYNEVKVDE